MTLGPVSEHDPHLPPLPPFDHQPLEEPDPAPEPSGEASGRVCWVDLDDADRARRILDELRAWMGTALACEPHVVELVRPCWYRHPGVVQTLLDVRAAWHLAHRAELSEAAAADRALEFTERHLPHLEARLARLLAQCTSVRHDPPDADLPRPDERDMAAYLDWWTGPRTGPETGGSS